MEYEWFDNLEDFVKWQLNVNLGSKTPIMKQEIENMFIEQFPNVSTKKLTKSEMIDELLKVKGWKEIYDIYKDNSFGIKPFKWKDKFDLTSYQMKKMAECNFLLFPTYMVYEKVFTGTYACVQYYRAEEYFNTTVEEVEEWKSKNIRGYNKKKKV